MKTFRVNCSTGEYKVVASSKEEAIIRAEKLKTDIPFFKYKGEIESIEEIISK